MTTSDTTLAQKIGLALRQADANLTCAPFIQQNLNPAFPLRPYQIEAFARFAYYMQLPRAIQQPRQLLFHMATGSGKTLMMAGLLLDLYDRGYRNFIFFVNSTNIINKTRDNFLNNLSAKYLFHQRLNKRDKSFVIKEVQHFETENKTDISILFTTIQGLHARLNTPRENSVTYEDFEDKKICLLSDEAHHINVTTKKGKPTKNEAAELFSWENTVNKILAANTENILLEFTATADFSNAEIKAKYQDKLIFDYSLKQFRVDKYSKEVQVLQTALPPFERGLQAVLLSQYRKKVFENHRLMIKPVLLFKSKTIKNSQAFFEEFCTKIRQLSVEKLHRMLGTSSNSVMQKVSAYFEKKGVTMENLLLELQEDFSVAKCIAIDSQNDSSEKQLIINNLESENNEYRVVFAVDKLNEGWDVLNLFDIVRLYNTKETEHQSKKISKTTLSEAQLIGRGARYCPFQLHEHQAKYQRKYDDEPNHDLRIGEELYYHAAHNPAYVSELSKALIEIGIKAAKTERLPQHNTARGSSLNDLADDNKTEERLGFSKAVLQKVYKIQLLTGQSTLSQAFGDKPQTALKMQEKIYELGDFPQPILRKALNKLPFYQFDNLQKRFPNLVSMTEFITSERYLKQIKIAVQGTLAQVEKPLSRDLLAAAVLVLEEISLDGLD